MRRIDHVDALGTLGGAHEHGLVLHEQVLALDQLDAHLLGEEGVLEVGAVVVPGREQDDDRGCRRGRGATARSVSSSRSG
jgi:hypothetical protein